MVGRVDLNFPRFGEIVIEEFRFDHDVIVEMRRLLRRKKGPSKASGPSSDTPRCPRMRRSHGRLGGWSVPEPTAACR